MLTIHHSRPTHLAAQRVVLIQEYSAHKPRHLLPALGAYRVSVLPTVHRAWAWHTVAPAWRVHDVLCEPVRVDGVRLESERVDLERIGREQRHARPRCVVGDVYAKRVVLMVKDFPHLD